MICVNCASNACKYSWYLETQNGKEKELKIETTFYFSGRMRHRHRRQSSSNCSFFCSRKGAYGNAHFFKRHQKSHKEKGYNNTTILTKSKPKQTQSNLIQIS